NGRYLVYPYYQDNSQAYAAHCILPGREDDHFWHGNETFAEGEFRVYNAPEIQRCQAGALFVTDGELNLMILKELGYPAVAVPDASDLAHLVPGRLALIDHVFLLMRNTPQARLAARTLAVELGFKARILSWPDRFERGGHLSDLACDGDYDTQKTIARMIRSSKSFSPFASVQKEKQQLEALLERDKDKQILGLATGFEKLDRSLEGLRGINILGGPPKAGKSCFFMQVSTEVARRKRPVIYYDFENGRQKIYLRTLVRLSEIPEKKIRQGRLDEKSAAHLEQALGQWEDMLSYFRVVTDRALSPEIMRRHIDFIQHETRMEDLLIVIDSLHKLPFKDLSERRTGIDSWLRQLESIRDEQGACFLVISELSRGKGGAGLSFLALQRAIARSSPHKPEYLSVSWALGLPGGRTRAPVRLRVRA
ncbi:MAG: DnaB-like helicase C-terminal domain-containing protein, partial [Desulfosarcinaceae bacterium]